MTSKLKYHKNYTEFGEPYQLVLPLSLEALNAKVNSSLFTLARFISVTDSCILDNAVCLLERSFLCLMNYIPKNI